MPRRRRSRRRRSSRRSPSPISNPRSRSRSQNPNIQSANRQQPNDTNETDQPSPSKKSKKKRYYKNCNCHKWREFKYQRHRGAAIPKTHNKTFTHTTQRVKQTTRLNICDQIRYSDLCRRVFRDPTINTIIRGINAHADMKEDEKFERIPLNSRGRWQIRIYLLIYVAMRVYNKNTKDFWQMNEAYGYYFLSQHMTRKTWQSMNTHFVMNEYERYDKTHPNFHPYAPYKTGMELITRDFNELIEECNVKTVDESRVTNNSPHQTYMTYLRCKPIRKGVNIFTVAVRTQLYSGVIIDSIPYAGRRTYTEQKSDDLKMTNVMNQFFDRNGSRGDVWVHDSAFTSMEAFDIAKTKGIGCIGQVDWTRKHLPRETFQTEEFKKWAEKSPKGVYRQFVCGEKTLTIWKDTSLVWILDNCVDRCKHARIVRTEGKHLKSGSKNPHSGNRRQMVVPEVIVKYNQYMGRVDDANSARRLFNIDRQNKRKHIRTYLAMIEFYLLTNTVILYADEMDDKHVKHKELRIELIHDWIYQYKIEFPTSLKPRRMTFKSIAQSVLNKSPLAMHQLMHFDSNKRSRQIKCKYCYNFRRQRRDTTWACSVCTMWAQPVGLCKNADCFDRWHEELQQEWSKYQFTDISSNVSSPDPIQSEGDDDTDNMDLEEYLSIANVDWSDDDMDSEHESDYDVIMEMNNEICDGSQNVISLPLQICDTDQADDDENVDTEEAKDNEEGEYPEAPDHCREVHNYLLRWFENNSHTQMIDEDAFTGIINMDNVDNTGIQNNLAIANIQDICQYLNDKHNSGILYDPPNICNYQREPSVGPMF